MCRRPQDLLAAILRVPFVDMFTCMTRPELPLTVHEYGEWGDPSDPKVLLQVGQHNQDINSLSVKPVMLLLISCCVPVICTCETHR